MKRPLFPLSFAVVTAVVISVVLLSGASSPRIHAQVAGDRTAVQCGNGLLNGRYGYEIKGTLAGIGPVVLVGTINHQSFNGTYTGAMTASYNGQIVPFLPFSGVFNVNSDCTGTSAFTLPDGTKVTTRIVVVERGKEYFIINTDAGNVLSGVIKRID